MQKVRLSAFNALLVVSYDEPINEYETSYLATMVFPTLFPKGKGDPTNQSLLRDIPLHEKIKHLIKIALV